MAAGHKMLLVRDFVEANPGTTLLAAALRAGPSTNYGYQTCWRAVAAGLIRAVPRRDKKNCFRLYPAATSPTGIATEKLCEAAAIAAEGPPPAPRSKRARRAIEMGRTE